MDPDESDLAPFVDAFGFELLPLLVLRFFESKENGVRKSTRANFTAASFAVNGRDSKCLTSALEGTQFIAGGGGGGGSAGKVGG